MRMCDIVDVANETNLPVAILSLDQEKAFDRVHWNILLATLSKMGFGPSLFLGLGFCILKFEALCLLMDTSLISFPRLGESVRAVLFHPYSMSSRWRFWLLTFVVTQTL